MFSMVWANTSKRVMKCYRNSTNSIVWPAKLFNAMITHYWIKFWFWQNYNFMYTFYFVLCTLTLKNDSHLTSPYNITSESYIKVMRIKEMITNWKSSWLLNALDCKTNSPCQHLRKRINNSMESIHTEVRM